MVGIYKGHDLVGGLVGELVGDPSGVAPPADDHTITVGIIVPKATLYGYNVTSVQSAFGSIDVAEVPWATRDLRAAYWDTNNDLRVAVEGTVGNINWTSIDINGNSYNRADATYSVNADGDDHWLWASVIPNPFGTTEGALIPVNWTV
jgi:hypothetical protein